MYQDTESRQHMPWEISLDDRMTSVKAITKDDILKNPRYAVKHYRRLLIDLAKDEENEFQETLADGSRNYDVPLLSAETLIYSRLAEFANFYIDMVLRYARALLSKGEKNASVHILRQVIDNDKLFQNVGDAERMAQCCRLLGRLSGDHERLVYLQRSVGLLRTVFSRVSVDDDYLVLPDSQLTDELVGLLNDMAFTYAQLAQQKVSRSQRKLYLSSALNIYMANLEAVSGIKLKVETGELTQASYPLFNCDNENLRYLCAEIKAHVSEILWANNHKQAAVSWGEGVVDDIYFDVTHAARAGPIVQSVLSNLLVMYRQLKDKTAEARCRGLADGIELFEGEPESWYDSMVVQFTKILYYRGPLHVLEKALKERFGPALPLPDIEQLEAEDEE